MVPIALVGAVSECCKLGSWNHGAMFKRISRSELVYRRLKASDQAKVYAGLLWLVKVKGYKPGWAAHKFKELMGDWPDFPFAVKPEQPPSDLLTWIERQRRNYGNRMKRQEDRATKDRAMGSTNGRQSGTASLPTKGSDDALDAGTD